MKKGPIILSVGGSLLAPEGIDVDFIKKFKDLIVRHTENGERFAIIAGGGKTARVYQEGARAISKISAEDADWVGIFGTKLNAQLLRAVFAPLAGKRIIDDPSAPIDFKEKVIIGAGYEPGWSSDMDAVLIAKNLGAKKLVNLSNIDYVYDKDPRKNPDAKKIEEISWRDFRKIIPEKWDPGLNSPFDPNAAKEAEKMGLEVAVMNGKNLENLDAYLLGASYQGTRIH
ncbi:MAG: UMP kinase [Candidatus Pacebacteria bacterium]|nr:UMP kinase [Candidatus Paceibacterota bacterium]